MSTNQGHTGYIIMTRFIFSVLLLFVFAVPAGATTWVNVSAEAASTGTVIENLTSLDGYTWTCEAYPSLSLGQATVTAAPLTAPLGTKYLQWHIVDGDVPDNEDRHGAGPSCNLGSAITLSAGTTYYLGVFVRFQRVGGVSKWRSYYDYDKMIGMNGNGFRWLIEAGWPGLDEITYSAGKFTFTLSVAKSVVPSWPHYDHLYPNQSPYGSTNPPYCDYEKWYAVVIGVTAYANSSGRVRLWVNGGLTSDWSGQTMESGGQISFIEHFGTINQPGYDSPEHYIQMDGIILTDSMDTITTAGLMQDPESGSRKLQNVTGVRVTLH